MIFLRYAALPVSFAVTAALIGAVGTARAQHAAYARDRVESAESLAKRAIDCLHRGEDAPTKDSKLAAYREGLSLASEAVAADDRCADAHYALFANKGRISLMEGVSVNPFNLMNANRELDRALELDPNHADALAARGGMYHQLPRLLGGDMHKAAEYLNRAIALDPVAVGARIELAETYRDMGEPQRGVPLLQEAAELAQRLGKQRQLAQARSLLQELQAR